MKLINLNDGVSTYKVLRKEKFYIIARNIDTKEKVKIARTYFPFNGKYMSKGLLIEITLTVKEIQG